jgi:RimJ/RimL family protein N-acetyltransferase
MPGLREDGVPADRSGDASSGGVVLHAYPSEMELDVTTATGYVVHLRPIRPDDDGRLIDFHADLSARSVYRRFFFVHPELSPAEVQRFTNVDYVNRLALIVELDDRFIAVGRYDRDPGSEEAEVAFIVTDEFQRRGIASLLLEQLAAAAWRVGIKRFTAQTHSDNAGMIRVFKASGFPVTSTMEHGVVTLRFPIEPTDQSLVARAQFREQSRQRARERAEGAGC